MTAVLEPEDGWSRETIEAALQSGKRHVFQHFQISQMSPDTWLGYAEVQPQDCSNPLRIVPNNYFPCLDALYVRIEYGEPPEIDEIHAEARLKKATIVVNVQGHGFIAGVGRFSGLSRSRVDFITDERRSMATFSFENSISTPALLASTGGRAWFGDFDSENAVYFHANDAEVISMLRDGEEVFALEQSLTYTHVAGHRIWMVRLPDKASLMLKLNDRMYSTWNGKADLVSQHIWCQQERVFVDSFVPIPTACEALEAFIYENKIHNCVVRQDAVVVQK